VFSEQDDKVCYMSAKPKKQEGTFTRRGDVFALVTHRSKDGVKNVFSYIAGYTYKEDSEVTLQIDDKTFRLFTKKNTAWAMDSETDDAIATALRSGEKMIVKGVSERNTKSTDTFSLNGSGKAFDKITAACF
jgi:hypothetical protein